MEKRINNYNEELKKCTLKKIIKKKPTNSTVVQGRNGMFINRLSLKNSPKNNIKGKNSPLNSKNLHSSFGQSFVQNIPGYNDMLNKNDPNKKIKTISPKKLASIENNLRTTIINISVIAEKDAQFFGFDEDVDTFKQSLIRKPTGQINKTKSKFGNFNKNQNKNLKKIKKNKIKKKLMFRNIERKAIIYDSLEDEERDATSLPDGIYIFQRVILFYY